MEVEIRLGRNDDFGLVGNPTWGIDCVLLTPCLVPTMLKHLSSYFS